MIASLVHVTRLPRVGLCNLALLTTLGGGRTRRLHAWTGSVTGGEKLMEPAHHVHKTGPVWCVSDPVPARFLPETVSWLPLVLVSQRSQIPAL